jgi:hypothetical protein
MNSITTACHSQIKYIKQNTVYRNCNCFVFEQLLLSIIRQHSFIIHLISIKYFTFRLITCYRETHSKIYHDTRSEQKSRFSAVSIVIHTCCYLIAVSVMLPTVQKTNFIRYWFHTVKQTIKWSPSIPNLVMKNHAVFHILSEIITQNFHCQRSLITSREIYPCYALHINAPGKWLHV